MLSVVACTAACGRSSRCVSIVSLYLWVYSPRISLIYNISILSSAKLNFQFVITKSTATCVATLASFVPELRTMKGGRRVGVASNGETKEGVSINNLAIRHGSKSFKSSTNLEFELNCLALQYHPIELTRASSVRFERLGLLR